MTGSAEQQLLAGLVLGFFPSWLASTPADWPKQLKLVGFPIADQPAEDSALEPALLTFLASARASSTPVFAFALGSAPPPYARAYFATAVEACRKMGARALVLCTVPGVVPEPLSAHAHHAVFAPFSALLPHVAALGFNGGIGGASEALRAGTPQVRTPALQESQQLLQQGADSPSRRVCDSLSRQAASISLTTQSGWFAWASQRASTWQTSASRGAPLRCRSCAPRRPCEQPAPQLRRISRSRRRRARRQRTRLWRRLPARRCERGLLPAM